MMSGRNEIKGAAAKKAPPVKRGKKKRGKAAREPSPPAAAEARAEGRDISVAEISEFTRKGSAAARFLAALNVYCNFVYAPPILADRLRRKGDPAACPRDFECWCEVDAETARPACDRLRDGCRFAPADGGAPPRIYGKRAARFYLVYPECGRRVGAWLNADEVGRHAMMATLIRGLRSRLQAACDQHLQSSAGGNAKEEVTPPR